MNAAYLREQLLQQANPLQAAHSQKFFKTGPGEYAEGDVFCGIRTPQIRAIAKLGAALPLAEVDLLLQDAVHEVRACALFILVIRFTKAGVVQRQRLVDLYLQRTAHINNWDLVDCSCGMLGLWLLDKERHILYQLAASENLWEQRIALVSTLPLIKHGEYVDTLRLAEKLMTHQHDLIHKAIGWMLREVGKKDGDALRTFLQRHYNNLPRTALRYAIERLPEEERKEWLRKK